MVSRRPHPPAPPGGDHARRLAAIEQGAPAPGAGSIEARVWRARLVFDDHHHHEPARVMNMPFLRLTVTVRDIRRDATQTRIFYRSPVTVGRTYGSDLPLDDPMVSPNHGAFIFTQHSTEYIDLASAHGTTVDGLPLLSDIPVCIRHGSIIHIGSQEITARLDRLPREEIFSPASAGSMASAAIALAAAGQHPAIHRILSSYAPSELLAHSLRLLEIVVRVVLEFRDELALACAPSPLLQAATAEEMIAYLIDPKAPDERLDELLTLLVDLITAPSPAISRSGSS